MYLFIYFERQRKREVTRQHSRELCHQGEGQGKPDIS